MSKLDAPYEINKIYVSGTSTGSSMASIIDGNGIWFIDCLETEAVEIVKRLNGYQNIEQELLKANGDNELLKQSITDEKIHAVGLFAWSLPRTWDPVIGQYATSQQIEAYSKEVKGLITKQQGAWANTWATRNGVESTDQGYKLSDKPETLSAKKEIEELRARVAVLESAARRVLVTSPYADGLEDALNQSPLQSLDAIQPDTVYILQSSDASYSLSLDEDYVDSIEMASYDESVIDDFIKDNEITLGKVHLYDANYAINTKKAIEIQRSVKDGK